MTAEDVQLVQGMFARVLPVKVPMATMFYKQLFEIAPDMRPIFPDNMAAQHAKLADSLAFLVKNLNAPAKFESEMRSLSRRHVIYGACPVHFAKLGAALADVLETYTPGGLSGAELRAWSNTYTYLSNLMIEGAKARA